MVKLKAQGWRKMISTTYDNAKKCAYLKGETGEYVGTLYGVYATEVKGVGAYKKVTFKNAKGLPLLVLLCEYTE